jgi:hypothetical protein
MNKWCPVNCLLWLSPNPVGSDRRADRQCADSHCQAFRRRDRRSRPTHSLSLATTQKAATSAIPS